MSEPKPVRRRFVTQLDKHGRPCWRESPRMHLESIQLIESRPDDPDFDELIAASQAAVDMWDSPLYKLQMKPVIDRLRNALKRKDYK